MTAQIKCQVCDQYVDAFNITGHKCKGKPKDPFVGLEHPFPERVTDKLLAKLDHTLDLLHTAQEKNREFEDFLIAEKLLDKFVTWRVTKRLEGREVC